MTYPKKKEKRFNRYIALLAVMFFVFSVLVAEMVKLQVIHGASYADQANIEFIRHIDKQAPRGEITDAQGRVLATSRQSYNLLYVDTTDARRELYRTLDRVIDLLALTGEEINDTFSLKMDPFRLEFNTDDAGVLRRSQLRWKKDRGIHEHIFNTVMRQETGKSRIADLNEGETDRLDELTVAYSAEDTFYYLLQRYRIYDALEPTAEERAAFQEMTGAQIYRALLEEFSAERIRTYLYIRDSITMESYQGSRAVTIVSNMKEETAFIFHQQVSLLSGIQVETNPVRVYPYSTMAAHVVGYLNPIPAGSQDVYRERGYDISSDYIGVSGIESAYEALLRGTKGGSTVRVDRFGRPQTELFRLDAYPGHTVELTLDLELQNVAEKALEEMMLFLRDSNARDFEGAYFNTASTYYKGTAPNATRGAVVVTEVATGRVLAMASNPAYDPNAFAVPGRLTPELFQEYFNPDYRAYAEELIQRMNLRKEPEDLFRFNADGTVNDINDLFPRPMFNYATQGLTPSGSTFKVVTALAALEANVITPNTVIRDTGLFSYGGWNLRNFGNAIHGNLEVVRALAVSSNVFFAEIAQRLYNREGLNALAEWGWKLGLGRDPGEPLRSTTGIEIGDNLFGNVYNHYGKVELTQRLMMFDIVARLNSTVRRGGGSKTPIDIGVNRADDDDIAQAKEDIKIALRSAVNIPLELANQRRHEVSYQELVRELTPLFQRFIDLLPEEQQAQASAASVYADDVAQFVIFDMLTQLYSPVNIFNAALGQGDTQLNLLQVNNALATIVNGGTRYKNTLVSRVLDHDGNVVEETAPVVLEEVEITDRTLATLKQGLIATNTVAGGSGRGTFLGFPIETGGKTGTAQFRDTESDREVGRNSFGIYTGVAPVMNPEIAVSVIIYDGASGAAVVPVVRALFEEYFKDVLERDYPDYVRTFQYAMPQPEEEGAEQEPSMPSEDEEETPDATSTP